MCQLQNSSEGQRSAAGRRILIVEDHLATAKGLTLLLNMAFADASVHIATSAEDALEHCETAPPHVVIMDISLPGMNGLDATRKIKALYPAAQVLMHTNNDMQVFQTESESAGASAFISKRLTSTQLVPAIARLLAPAEPQG